MTHARDADPFAATTRTAAYVPRPDTERALELLKAWVLDGGAATIDLTAAPGMGKSLLLRVLAERLSGHLASVHVPFPGLAPDELARCVLDVMGEPSDPNPQAELCEAAKRRAGEGGLLLLLDNAERLPPETRAALDHWFQGSAGNLRSVCAVVGEPTVAGPLPSGPGEGVALTQRLRIAESTALIEAALDRARITEAARARFNHATLLQIHDRARGVPACLLAEAARVLAASGSEVAPSTALRTREPAPAPTQRALAQLELGLPADSAPAPEPRPETPPTRDTRAQPDPSPEPDPALEPAALLDAPPPPRAASTRRPRGVSARIAAAGGIALVLAFATVQLLTTGDPEDLAGVDPVATDVPARATAPETPPVAAPPTAAAMPPSADPGVGSIELLGALPAATGSASEPAPSLELPPIGVAAPVTIAAAEATTASVPTGRDDSADADDEVVEGSIREGEWLAASFRRLGVPGELAGVIAREVGDAYDFRHSQVGDRYRLTRNRAGELADFEYEIAPGDFLELRLEDGRYRVRRSSALGSSSPTARD